jgi:hypothetical protein
MLFNTPATREMTDKVNFEFSGGKLTSWRARLGDFGSMNLHGVAHKWGVVPGGGNGPKARWKYWLDNILGGTACSPLTPYPVMGIIQYPPSGSGTSNVGHELKRLIIQALGDMNCKEIIMVVQPDYSVRVSQAETIPVAGMSGAYSLALTVCTIEIPSSVAAATKRAKKKAAKKRKA